MEKPIEVELRKGEVLQLQAGDVVVFTVEKPITMDHAHKLREAAMKILPAGIDIMILDEGTKLSVLRGLPKPAGVPEVMG